KVDSTMLSNIKNINSSNKYLLVMVFFAIVTSIFVLYINYLFDPLWYFKGNRVGEFNVRFDERLTKTNRFLKQPYKYDCVIFGSSRATLLNENRIKNNVCFNYSFSGGYAVEHLAFAQYVKKRGKPLDVVIMSVEGFNFLKSPSEYNIPVFILEQSRPTHWIKNYLSLRALKFSARVLKGGEFSRQYTNDFIGVEVNRISNINVKKDRKAIKELLNKNVIVNNEEQYSNERVTTYREIRKIFLHSKFVGYVPPISADRIILLYIQGQLDSYLKALYLSSNIFNEFYDFSIPSEITLNPNNSYDGSHFYPEINNLVVDKMMNDKKVNEFGVNVKALSYSEYYEIYVKKIKKVLKEGKLL
ncbi:hypothetical protein N8135_03380, partial [Oceanospirillaceae bacterium]|nr:hypothetical protein [Oceanospirillaceae bacterium]